MYKKEKTLIFFFLFLIILSSSYAITWSGSSKLLIQVNTTNHSSLNQLNSSASGHIQDSDFNMNNNNIFNAKNISAHAVNTSKVWIQKVGLDTGIFFGAGNSQIYEISSGNLAFGGGTDTISINDLGMSYNKHLRFYDYANDKSYIYAPASGYMEINTTYGLKISNDTIFSMGINVTNNLNVNGNITGKNIIAYGDGLQDKLLGYRNARIGENELSGLIGFEYKLGADNTLWQIDNGGDGLRFFNDSYVFMRINKTEVSTPVNIHADGNITGNTIYGSFFNHTDAGTTITIGVQNQWYNFIYVDCGDFNNGFKCTSDVGTLQALHSGVYEGTHMESGSGVNAHLYHTAILINQVPVNSTEGHMEHNNVADVTPMTGNGFFRLTAGDNVTVAVSDSSGTGDGTVYKVSLTLKRIGN